jgi:hypothetical protein
MSFSTSVLLSFVVTGALSATTINVTVPGISDPWLAGMPNGSTASVDDSAPAQSPVLVALALVPGTPLTFSATGGVSNTPGCNLITLAGCDPPDGSALISHLTGAENGIATVTAPLNSLVGVFLANTQPSLTVAPAGLDFSVIGLNFTTLAPSLKQVFFIGDGTTSTAVVQKFTVPAGATRLFLGTMDGFEWSNNSGQFVVTVTGVPEPGTFVLLIVGVLGFLVRRILCPVTRP